MMFVTDTAIVLIIERGRVYVVDVRAPLDSAWDAIQIAYCKHYDTAQIAVGEFVDKLFTNPSDFSMNDTIDLTKDELVTVFVVIDPSPSPRVDSTIRIFIRYEPTDKVI